MRLHQIDEDVVGSDNSEIHPQKTTMRPFYLGFQRADRGHFTHCSRSETPNRPQCRQGGNHSDAQTSEIAMGELQQTGAVDVVVSETTNEYIYPQYRQPHLNFKYIPSRNIFIIEMRGLGGTTEDGASPDE